jgi:membrane protein implicated in regulation of membrane protease activity
MLTATFIALGSLGCLYIAFSAFAGHLFDFGTDDAHSPGHGEDGEFHFPLFSPLALATLAATTGGFGLIALHAFDVSEGASAAVAIPAAIITTWLVTWVGFRLVKGSRGSSTFTTEAILGATGEVSAPIPEGSVGEVTLLVNGQRFVTTARADPGVSLPRGALIRVRAMSGTTAIVEAA